VWNCEAVKLIFVPYSFFLVFSQEEGWLTGMVLTSGVKGIFPANFTKKQV